MVSSAKRSTLCTVSRRRAQATRWRSRSTPRAPRRCGDSGAARRRSASTTSRRATSSSASRPHRTTSSRTAPRPPWSSRHLSLRREHSFCSVNGREARAPMSIGVPRTVAAVRYVTPLREGGSLPAIVEADDDGLYVLKFRGAGQGPKALIAELVAGELARALGLLVPEIVFAVLDAELGRTEPDQ